MSGYSLRTVMFVIAGVATVCGLMTVQGLNAFTVHLLLVLAFAVPGGSYGFDVGRDSRGVLVGACLAAVVGTLLLSGLVLLMDVVALYFY